MNKTDTTVHANNVLIDIYRQMPPRVKLIRIFQAYTMGKTLAMAGLRDTHPHASEKQIRQLWAKQHLGEKLYNEAYGETLDE